MVWIDTISTAITGIVVSGLVWCMAWGSIGDSGVGGLLASLAIGAAAIFIAERGLTRRIGS